MQHQQLALALAGLAVADLHVQRAKRHACKHTSTRVLQTECLKRRGMTLPEPGALRAASGRPLRKLRALDLCETILRALDLCKRVQRLALLSQSAA
eukprot:359983-Chlamydomonas_euryale.AAC.4